MVATPPCQPFSKANVGAQGKEDPRNGFPVTAQIIRRLPGIDFVIENVVHPYAEEIAQSLKVTPQDRWVRGPQLRRRRFLSSVQPGEAVNSQYVGTRPAMTWQEALDRAGQGGEAPKKLSPTLCAREDTWAERDGTLKVRQGKDGQMRTMTAEEREALVGLKIGDTASVRKPRTKKEQENLRAYRWKATGNAVPVHEWAAWLWGLLGKRLTEGTRYEQRNIATAKSTNSGSNSYVLPLVSVARGPLPDKEEIRRIHSEAGHPGVRRTKELVAAKTGCKEEEIAAMVQEELKVCDFCQRFAPRKMQRDKKHMLPLPLQSEPFSEVVMDECTGLPLAFGFSQFVTIVDRYSKFVVAVPLRHHTDTEDLLRELKDRFYLLMRVPDRFWFDAGTRFTSDAFDEGFPQSVFHVGVPDRKGSQGEVEVQHRLILRQLRAAIFEQCKKDKVAEARWPEMLARGVAQLNQFPRPDLGISPAEMLYGRPGCLQATSRDAEGEVVMDAESRWARWTRVVDGCILAAYQRKRAYLDLMNEREAVISHPLPVGSECLIPNKTRVKSRLEDPAWSGPYRIIQYDDRQRSYLLKNENKSGARLIWRSLVIPYKRREEEESSEEEAAEQIDVEEEAAEQIDVEEEAAEQIGVEEEAAEQIEVEVKKPLRRSQRRKRASKRRHW